MRNWLLINSIVCILFATACKQHTATETEQSADTPTLRVDTSAYQPDRTNVEPDSAMVPGDSVINDGIPASNENGSPGKPGPKPKPGKMSGVDSIKASYPPKK